MLPFKIKLLTCGSVQCGLTRRSGKFEVERNRKATFDHAHFLHGTEWQNILVKLHMPIILNTEGLCPFCVSFFQMYCLIHTLPLVLVCVIVDHNESERGDKDTLTIFILVSLLSWVVFMSTGHKLESSEKSDTQLRKCHHRIKLQVNLWTFS